MTRRCTRVRLVAQRMTVMAMLAGAAAACHSPAEVSSGDVRGPASSSTDAASSGQTVHMVAVGDIVCEPGTPSAPDECQHLATAELAGSLRPDAVVALGDLQYETGGLEDFQDSWATSWGRFDDIITPVPGNHEYGTDAASGYTSYFDTGPYYARDIGAWRFYLLDSNCDRVDCDQQASWLADDLASHPTRCTAIAMHHPRWSSSMVHGSQEQVDVLWATAVDAGVDLSLAAHDHDYERFAPIDAAGDVESTEPAATHFVVGTGGRSFYQLGDPEPGSAFAADDVFGVLDLTLHAASFDWRFIDTAGTVLDEGERACS